MVKQALSIPSALLTGPYSRFAWVFTAGFLITFALGWSFAYFFVAFFAALFARVFSWTEVYLMPVLAIFIIVVVLAFVALVPERLTNWQSIWSRIKLG